MDDERVRPGGGDDGETLLQFVIQLGVEKAREQLLIFRRHFAERRIFIVGLPQFHRHDVDFRVFLPIHARLDVTELRLIARALLQLRVVAEEAGFGDAARLSSGLARREAEHGDDGDGREQAHATEVLIQGFHIFFVIV